VEKFKYLGVVSRVTEDGTRVREIDTRFGTANAVALRELTYSVMTKWEFSNTAKLSVFD